MKRILKTAALTLASVMLLSACGAKNADTLASVNGEDITKEDFKKTIALYSPSYELQFGPDVWDTEIEPGVTFHHKFQEEIYEKLISDKVIEQEAKKKEITVPDEEVEKDFTNLKKSLETQKEFNDILTKNNIDDAYLKNQIKKDKTIQKFFEATMKENEAKEEEVKKYYDDRISAFTKSEVKASHILISTKDSVTGAVLSDEEKAKKEKLAREILEKAKSGKNFAELAKAHSEDPGSAKQGGDLGYFTRDRMVKPFSDAAFSLKVGEISDLVESEYGYHIIKVIDKKEEVQRFEDVKQSIKENLEYEKYQNLIAKLQEDAKIERNEEAFKQVSEEIVNERKNEMTAPKEGEAQEEPAKEESTEESK